MVYTKQPRGERRFESFESGGVHLSDILGALAPLAGSIATSVVGAGASALLGGLFGDEDEVESAYNPAIEALNRNAEMSGRFANEAFSWGKSTWGQLDQQTRDIVSRLEPIAARQGEMAASLSDLPDAMRGTAADLTALGSQLTGYGMDALGRHADTFQPLEQEWIKDYQDYTSGGRMALEESRAAEDVGQAFDAQRENALRQLEGYGIDPSQTRAALDLNVQLAEAAQKAQAQTNARRYVEDTGRSMREGILGYGQNYQNWGSNLSQLGGATTESAGNMYGNAATAGTNVAGIYGQQASTVGQGGELYNRSANTGANLYGVASPYLGNSTTARNAALGGVQNQQAGMSQERGRYDVLGEGIGAAAGNAVAGYMNRGASNQSVQKKALGGEIKGPGGPYDDKVPVMGSDGEYVIPYEVVHRKGTEFFDRMVEKVRGDVQAIPT